MTAAANYPSDYRQWLAKLISFDTVSRNSNLPLVDYVKAYLKTVGVESTLVYNPARTHANLWATLPGEGGVTQGGIVLSGHTDVVPVDGQKWDTDPFTMVEKDGKLFGRGACDMKGFLAVVLALVPQLLSMKRAKPVHIAFSFDEEVGCRGVPYLIDYLKAKGFKADGCLIGEPTGMKVETGNKGRTAWEVKVHGKAIHSSMALMNTSCNAIEYAAQIITKIREIALDIRKNGRHDPLYTCPFASISTGIIKGGNAVNTVPAECEFTFSMRVTEIAEKERVESELKQYISSVVLPAMRKEFAEAQIEMVRTADYPSFTGSDDNALTQEARRLRADPHQHRSGGGTEAGYFHGVLNIPSVIVGPGGVDEAHQPNEFVSVQQMDCCVATVTGMVSALCGVSKSSHV
ncbi:glutamamyl carboxypeptidase putativemetallo-peptidase Clan MH Family M18 [Leptomonas pyrrhocoris]|uniref:Glutamamyl carboxypeptidase putativemetallo-peptidase Clan MH Family M18 n=1 Tax=Leptomonas pyrrhocoris TaxID=157538 RepID=A0A0M9FYQ5_LEPPY|nr:glutamamyl carboxypeptidase putativemetallo-peptidase Clan MH Family M18 [Leptomonas pyrrhocoris]XP_015657255.1 glutamamyl carboxypeptidase putativemetallo-peptidase Clan MH Family M18 [Leptomonas pyrrhocoris]KPA78815.1 glutamamyl carboxypeptidase putativemetallo-peptidase Clan MH Family M18 [Leptomonas pyrrhocoris]KPA78816.1 glutamamyl carboxypeptidase putativemetallo-peptidase Clan MH Family M18 [Leptomonas pyrrhocoris]|eukprot:XP_015657254.1 glutamamyl carboxypeptidase putativemetallo-peptidase Clan MH Family M18 [Leptomonas pyrrhocoris]